MIGVMITLAHRSKPNKIVHGRTLQTFGPTPEVCDAVNGPRIVLHSHATY